MLINFRATKDLHAAFQAACTANGDQMSEVIREAMRQYIAAHGLGTGSAPAVKVRQS